MPPSQAQCLLHNIYSLIFTSQRVFLLVNSPTQCLNGGGWAGTFSESGGSAPLPAQVPHPPRRLEFALAGGDLGPSPSPACGCNVASGEFLSLSVCPISFLEAVVTALGAVHPGCHGDVWQDSQPRFTPSSLGWLNFALFLIGCPSSPAVSICGPRCPEHLASCPAACLEGLNVPGTQPWACQR